jgi:hypothetical protein
MFPKMNKIWVVIGLILLLFIFLNPTYLNFKEFTGITGKDAKNLHKKANFLICSIYQDDYNHKKYLGFVKNFIDITPASMIPIVERTDSAVSVSVDSVTAVVDSLNTNSEKIRFDPKEPYDIIEGNDTVHVTTDSTERFGLNYLELMHRLFSKKHDGGTFPWFVNKLRNPKTQKKFYDIMIKEYNLGSLEDFRETINQYYLDKPMEAP